MRIRLIGKGKCFPFGKTSGEAQALEALTAGRLCELLVQALSAGVEARLLTQALICPYRLAGYSG